MSTFKRSALVACVAGLVLVVVIFCILLWAPIGMDVLGVLRGIPVLLGLASVFAALAIIGAGWGVVRVVQEFTRTAARLSATDAGSISIEKSALVSVAAGALAGVPNVTVQAITVDVVPRRDTAVIDAEVTATPRGTDSLMALAADIQRLTKRALESFTEHEVRYVAVRFVESKRRGEPMSAGVKTLPADDGEHAASPASPVVPAAAAAAEDTCVPGSEGGHGRAVGAKAAPAAADGARKADSAKVADAACGAEPAPAASRRAGDPEPAAAAAEPRPDVSPEPEPEIVTSYVATDDEPGRPLSLWERAKAAVGRGRAKASADRVPATPAPAGAKVADEVDDAWWKSDDVPVNGAGEPVSEPDSNGVTPVSSGTSTAAGQTGASETTSAAQEREDAETILPASQEDVDANVGGAEGADGTGADEAAKLSSQQGGVDGGRTDERPSDEGGEAAGEAAGTQVAPEAAADAPTTAEAEADGASRRGGAQGPVAS